MQTTIQVQTLLDRLAAGDEQAMSELVEQAMHRLTLIARNLLNGFGGEQRVEFWTAEVVNEAFPRLAKAMDDLKPTSPGQFFGLARLQMQRVLLDKVRVTQKRKTQPLPAEYMVSGHAGENEMTGSAAADLLIDLLDTLGKLPDKQADTVYLKLAGYTHREIGEALGVHHDTIDTYWSNACVKLQKQLQPYMQTIKR